MKNLNRQELKNINKHFKLNTDKSDIELILSLLKYINDIDIDITIEDLEALSDESTKIIETRHAT
jgi:hypothetical protein